MTLPDATPSIGDATSTARRGARLRGAWRAGVAPRTDGLPNKWVLIVPLALLAAVFVALVSLGLTGSSTGIVHSQISTTADSDLIAGSPQPIRSDEWFVQTSWAISQVEQGLPLRNESFPGGMDATVQHDLPTRDWSTAFHPHLVGFLFLPLDQAMAMKWWLPGFAMIAAGFLFIITLLPRRPATAIVLSTAFYFSPFFHWWFLSITFYSAAWALLVMAMVTWCLKTQARVGQWVFAALVAYLTVALGTGIYVPFIVPAVLVALFVSVGLVLTGNASKDTVGSRVRKVTPVFIAGAAGGAVMVLWLVTRWSTIVNFTSTVYPGERLQEVGRAGLAQLDSLFSGVLSLGLERNGGQPFGGNSSEASTFLLPGLFLFALVIWLIVDRARAGRGIDWLSVATLSVGGLMFAFMFVPGWDSIAHALLLDRTTYGRLRLGFGLLSLVMVVVVAVRLEDRAALDLPKPPRWLAVVGVVLATVSVIRVVWASARAFGIDAVLSGVSPLVLIAGAVLLLLFVLTVWFFARGQVALGAALLLIVSVVSSAGVNPLYRGVLDLRETAIAQAIERHTEQQPGAWVGISTTPLPTMLLVETGVASFNGFQSSPSLEMWDEIDPNGDYEKYWNRLANVSWVIGNGAPNPRNPAPDQIQLTFDSCDAFARDNVTWVLSEVEVNQPCLKLAETVEQGPSVMRIYEVTRPAG